jgi:hypothetical protein
LHDVSKWTVPSSLSLDCPNAGFINEIQQIAKAAIVTGGLIMIQLLITRALIKLVQIGPRLGR